MAVSTKKGADVQLNRSNFLQHLSFRLRPERVRTAMNNDAGLTAHKILQGALDDVTVPTTSHFRSATLVELLKPNGSSTQLTSAVRTLLCGDVIPKCCDGCEACLAHLQKNVLKTKTDQWNDAHEGERVRVEHAITEYGRLFSAYEGMLSLLLDCVREFELVTVPRFNAATAGRLAASLRAIADSLSKKALCDTDISPTTNAWVKCFLPNSNESDGPPLSLSPNDTFFEPQFRLVFQLVLSGEVNGCEPLIETLIGSLVDTSSFNIAVFESLTTRADRITRFEWLIQLAQMLPNVAELIDIRVPNVFCKLFRAVILNFSPEQMNQVVNMIAESNKGALKLSGFERFMEVDLLGFEANPDFNLAAFVYGLIGSRKLLMQQVFWRACESSTHAEQYAKALNNFDQSRNVKTSNNNGKKPPIASGDHYLLKVAEDEWKKLLAKTDFDDSEKEQRKFVRSAVSALSAFWQKTDDSPPVLSIVESVWFAYKAVMASAESNNRVAETSRLWMALLAKLLSDSILDADCDLPIVMQSSGRRQATAAASGDAPDDIFDGEMDGVRLMEVACSVIVSGAPSSAFSAFRLVRAFVVFCQRHHLTFNAEDTDSMRRCIESGWSNKQAACRALVFRSTLDDIIDADQWKPQMPTCMLSTIVEEFRGMYSPRPCKDNGHSQSRCIATCLVDIITAVGADAASPFCRWYLERATNDFKSGSIAFTDDDIVLSASTLLYDKNWRADIKMCSKAISNLAKGLPMDTDDVLFRCVHEALFNCKEKLLAMKLMENFINYVEVAIMTLRFSDEQRHKFAEMSKGVLDAFASYYEDGVGDADTPFVSQMREQIEQWYLHDDGGATASAVPINDGGVDAVAQSFFVLELEGEDDSY